MIETEEKIRARVVRAKELIVEAGDMDMLEASQMFLIAAIASQVKGGRTLIKVDALLALAPSMESELIRILYQTAMQNIEKALPKLTIAAMLIDELDKRGVKL